MDQRSPGEHQIEVAVAIGIDQIGSFSLPDESGGAAHALESPHRAVDAAG
jgi:hypothetical protein